MAQYLVNQFEHADFEFDCVNREDLYQDKFEDQVISELNSYGGYYGGLLAVRMHAVKTKYQNDPDELDGRTL